MAGEVVLVVPCFNEEQRFQPAAFLALAREPNLHLVLVDDGSSDGTRRLLNETAGAAPGSVSVLSLEKNSGKGEAVRRGLLLGLERDPLIAGYVDADLATPIDEILRLIRELQTLNADVVFGARIARLGAEIERRQARHYPGRVFATLVSEILHLPVYDSQCGAKVFRAGPELRAALQRRFASRWAFDVELLARLITGSEGAPAIPIDKVHEIPLNRWIHVPGSKVRPSHLLRVGVDLIGIAREFHALTRRRFGPLRR